MLVVSDDGVGLPANFDFKNTNTLGLKLVHLLASQLGGSVRLSGSAGTVAQVEFPHKLAGENA
jgi:two-component sensor histidine kinase